MLTHKFTRPVTGIEVSGKEVTQIIADYIIEDPTANYEFTVGTDSQAFSDHTRIVEVIAVRRVGRGGIFFFYKDFVPLIKDLREKIITETYRSLENANGLLDDVELILLEKNIDINKLNIRFQVHCDIGEEGKTKMFIQEIVGWVQSYHFDCLIKPNSYTASGIADRLTK